MGAGRWPAERRRAVQAAFLCHLLGIPSGGGLTVTRQ